MSSQDTTKFTGKFVTKLLQKGFKDSTNTKFLAKDPAVEVCGELIRVFVLEACTRVANQAQKEESSTCDVEHVEKILPQLLLDF